MPGGQFLLTSRSGTNQWHGSAYDYFRNGALDANNWFNNETGTPRQAERQNDFGGTLGGPVRIPGIYNGSNRTFFFFSYEGLRLTAPTAAQTYLVPSLSLRQAATGAAAWAVNTYPLPNGPNADPNLAYYTGGYSTPSTVDSTSVRIDHRFSEKFSVFGRYSDSPSQVATRSIAGSSPLAVLNTSSNDTRR